MSTLPKYARDLKNVEAHNFLHVWYRFYTPAQRKIGWYYFWMGVRMNHSHEFGPRPILDP